MLEIARCVALDHDPAMLLLAAVVCCIGAAALVQMLERARTAERAQRLGWLFLSSMAAGATIWCTHFVAMLSYTAHLPVALDPVLTIASLLIAILGSGIAFGVNGEGRQLSRSIAGGAILGLAISVMHFMGMQAYRVDGIVSWRPGYVAAAIAAAVLFSVAALAVLGREHDLRHRLKVGTVLLIAAVVALHFTAMTAMQVTVIELSSEPLASGDIQVLGIGTALVGMLVIAAGIAAALIDGRTRGNALRELQHMAMTDHLTGLPNRNCFNLEIETRLDHARAAGHRKALAVMDLVRFKDVNDLYGHSVGDAVMKAFAHRLSSALLPGEFVARLGGDEFVVVKGYDDDAQLTGLARRLEYLTAEPVRAEEVEALIRASIGISTFPDDATDASTLVANADLAMLRAKAEKSRRVCFYDLDTDNATRARQELAHDLRHALNGGTELAVHYQVQAAIPAMQVTGFEALVRWQHPKRGKISPEEFISVAEENGMILDLGEWVLRRACSDAAAWPHDAKVAVNLSPLQLLRSDLPGRIEQILATTGLPADRLEIELTESAIMSDRDQSLETLQKIRALGIGIALDDFGTGYSSLETLRIFPFDKIKLDRFFLAEITQSAQARAMVRAVVSLGRSLGMRVLAEGIEEEQQLRILEDEGCDEAQGYFLGRPALLAATRASPIRAEAKDAAAPSTAGVAVSA